MKNFTQWNRQKQETFSNIYINEKEVWLVSLEPTKGIELQKSRPCLVIRKFSKYHYIIVPITSKIKNTKNIYELNVTFLKHQPSYLVISQIRIVDVERFSRKYGEVSEHRFKDIKNKTAEVLKLLPQKANAHNLN
jgi:mRNA interferase MazF